MVQILTANVASNLYWLGRHIERLQVVLIEINSLFDKVIDEDKDAGVRFYNYLDVALEYTNSSDFLNKAIFGDHSLNLKNVADNLRENAIICRAHISKDSFGEVIELSNLFLQTSKRLHSVDYKFIDQALSLLSEISGEMTKKKRRRKTDYFVELGRHVEKVDFHLRIGRKRQFAKIWLDEIDVIVDSIKPGVKFEDISSCKKSEIIDSINERINQIIIDPDSDS